VGVADPVRTPPTTHLRLPWATGHGSRCRSRSRRSARGRLPVR